MIVVKQCARNACSFRFPIKEDLSIIQKCPKCGSSVFAVAEYSMEMKAPRQIDNPKFHVEAYLDNLRSVFNVGSIFRSADGCGIKHLHLGGTTPTPAHPQMAKTALGAEALINWEHHWDGLSAVQNIKHQGYHLIALEYLDNSVPLFETQIKHKNPILLIVGNENYGIDPGILSECNQIVHLPMLGIKESLNVAVAFSIASYWLLFGMK
jgi:tRNA G18 (ribose-2'-O)-methylase SpoU